MVQCLYATPSGQNGPDGPFGFVLMEETYQRSGENHPVWLLVTAIQVQTLDAAVEG